MQTPSNEQLCVFMKKGNASASNLLLENNLGFIRKTANEIYQSMGLTNSGLVIDRDDLEQEGSLGLLKAAELFDAEKGMKFLTYAAPAIRNAMIDLIRSEYTQFEQKLTTEKDGVVFQIVRLDDLLSGEDKMLREEAVSHPLAKTPEQNYIEKENIRELWNYMMR